MSNMMDDKLKAIKDLVQKQKEACKKTTRKLKKDKTKEYQFKKKKGNEVQ